MRPNLHRWLFLAPAMGFLIAQTPADKSPAEVATHENTPTFSTRSNLVVVRVVVRDKDGRPNGNLQKEDFQVFDKGKPQFISKFSVEKSAVAKTDAKKDAKADEAAPATAVDAKQPEAPERYTAYLFDDIHMNAGDLVTVRAAAERHLTAGFLATSRAAIFTTSGRITLDFTDDLGKLRDTLNRIMPSPVTAHSDTDCPSVTYYQADLIQNKSDPQALAAAAQDAIVCARLDTTPVSLPGAAQTAAGAGSTQATAETMARGAASRELALGEQETRLSLIAVRDYVRRLASMPGQRSLVLVSPGFLVLDDHRTDEIDLMDRAIRANVVISALDARGLYTLMPGGDVSQAPGNLQTLRLRSQFQMDSALRNEDVMLELADGTGGIFVHNSNDLEGGLNRIDTPPDFYYMLGFSPDRLKFDGSFHALKVTLAKNYKGFTLQARRGYYAPRHEENAAEEAKREVEEALFSREEWHDIPASLETQFFKSTDEKAKLSVVARVDVKTLSYRKVDGRNVNKLTIVSGVFDRNGNCIDAIEKTIDMHLKDETLAHRLASGMAVKTAFDVTPGGYFVRLVVRDEEGQKMAALNGAVEIP